MNSLITKFGDDPNYSVGSKKSKFHGYTIKELERTRDEILKRQQGAKRQTHQPAPQSAEEEPDWELEGSGVADANALVDQLHISLGSIRAGNMSQKLRGTGGRGVTYKTSSHGDISEYIEMRHFSLLLHSALSRRQSKHNQAPENCTIHFNPPIRLDGTKKYRAALNELVYMAYL